MSAAPSTNKTEAYAPVWIYCNNTNRTEYRHWQPDELGVLRVRSVYLEGNHLPAQSRVEPRP